MKKRIAVTGGAGFLGANLCRRLLEEPENEVIAIDNLYTGNTRNIKILLQNPNFQFIQHNIIQPIELEVDEIYNAACPASPPHYQKSPTFTLDTCTVGMKNMLELATKKEAKILQFSTSEVYGDPQVHPQPESYRGYVNPIGFRSCYDEGKRCAEAMCFDYAREFGTNIKVIRIFNTYGPYMSPDDGRVISNFIVQALKGEDITIYGNGTQTRSFCYVDDLIEGILCMMNSEKAFRGPVNLGNPDEFTIQELANKVIRLTESKSRVVYKDLPSDDPTQRKPVIRLAKEKLNWEPRIKLEMGLKKTIEYMKKLIN